MTRTFTCRGFEGHLESWGRNRWEAVVIVADMVVIVGSGPTKSAAKSRVRRKLDAVERAFRERGRR